MKKPRKGNNKPAKPGDILLDDKKKPMLFNKNLTYSIAIGAVLILGIAFLYPIEKVYLPLDIPRLNEIAAEDIRAPFEFNIFKSEEELERDRQVVVSSLMPVLNYDTLLTQMVSDRVKGFLDLLDSIQVDSSSRYKAVADLKSHYPVIPDSVIITLLGGSEIIREAAVQIIDSLLARGVVMDISNLPLQNSGLAAIDGPSRTRTVARDRVFDLARARIFIVNQAERLSLEDTDVARAIASIAMMFLEPNLIFDKEKTEQSRKAELEAIQLTKGIVLQDELIIKAKERVTEVHRDKLASLAKYKRSRRQGTSILNFLLPPLGRLFFVAFPILFFVFFLFFFRREIIRSNTYLLLFALLIGLEVLLLNIVVSQGFLSRYLVPLTIASMLATILFDEEVGLALTVSLGLLVGVLSGFKLDIAFVTIISGTVAGFSVRGVRHRHEFFRPTLYLCLTYAGTVYIIESLKLTPAAESIKHVSLAVINGFLSPILTIGLLPLFESGFSITTDVTLLELSDLNRPLLKRLAIEAPGTYHHSIMIGTLAEDAAEAIGANSLLARVGSYYHDIGKMLKPEYFVENQTGATNKHEKLAPTMSAMILEAHVKEGVDLALRHNLPRNIIDFITGHHGTGVMSYFYDKAMKEHDNAADVRDFQYPGPNPRSKEVAIVMLADSVEAASRTLEDPKPARIRNQVHRIFMDKFDSGLLENSNLTLRDIKKIEDSFVRVLTAFHHRRIKYPDKREVPV
ncbi:MAG: HDIG domain-containing protein [candidate division Zixibacteria bacterium]|nr:HDIG domain-containing protein [candidate division Zixibacteria bacterium]